MNLPDVPIVREGFFATHFFTVKDQEKSRDFYVRILGGKLIKPDNPCYIKLAKRGSFSIPAVAQLPTSQRSSLRHRRTSTEPVASSICVSPTSGPATKNGATQARPFLRSR